MLNRPVFLSPEQRVGVGASPTDRYSDNINLCDQGSVFDPITQKCYPKNHPPQTNSKNTAQASGSSTTSSSSATNKYRGITDLSKSGTKDPNRIKIGGIVPRLTGVADDGSGDNSAGDGQTSTPTDQTQDPSFVNGCTSQGMFTFPGVDRCLTMQELQDLLQKQADCARTPGSTFDPATLTCKLPETPQPKLCSDGLPEDPTTGCQRTEPKTEDKAEEKKSSTGMILLAVGGLALLGGGFWWMSKSGSATRSPNPLSRFDSYDYDVIKRKVIDANMAVDGRSSNRSRLRDLGAWFYEIGATEQEMQDTCRGINNSYECGYDPRALAEGWRKARAEATR